MVLPPSPGAAGSCLVSGSSGPCRPWQTEVGFGAVHRPDE